MKYIKKIGLVSIFFIANSYAISNQEALSSCSLNTVWVGPQSLLCKGTSSFPFKEFTILSKQTIGEDTLFHCSEANLNSLPLRLNYGEKKSDHRKFVLQQGNSGFFLKNCDFEFNSSKNIFVLRADQLSDKVGWPVLSEDLDFIGFSDTSEIKEGKVQYLVPLTHPEINSQIHYEILNFILNPTGSSKKEIQPVNAMAADGVLIDKQWLLFLSRWSEPLQSVLGKDGKITWNGQERDIDYELQSRDLPYRLIKLKQPVDLAEKIELAPLSLDDFLNAAANPKANLWIPRPFSNTSSSEIPDIKSLNRNSTKPISILFGDQKKIVLSEVLEVKEEKGKTFINLSSLPRAGLFKKEDQEFKLVGLSTGHTGGESEILLFDQSVINWVQEAKKENDNLKFKVSLDSIPSEKTFIHKLEDLNLVAKHFTEIWGDFLKNNDKYLDEDQKYTLFIPTDDVVGLLKTDCLTFLEGKTSKEKYTEEQKKDFVLSHLFKEHIIPNQGKFSNDLNQSITPKFDHEQQVIKFFNPGRLTNEVKLAFKPVKVGNIDVYLVDQLFIQSEFLKENLKIADKYLYTKPRDFDTKVIEVKKDIAKTHVNILKNDKFAFDKFFEIIKQAGMEWVLYLQKSTLLVPENLLLSEIMEGMGCEKNDELKNKLTIPILRKLIETFIILDENFLFNKGNRNQTIKFESINAEKIKFSFDYMLDGQKKANTPNFSFGEEFKNPTAIELYPVDGTNHILKKKSLATATDKNKFAIQLLFPNQSSQIKTTKQWVEILNQYKKLFFTPIEISSNIIEKK